MPSFSGFGDDLSGINMQAAGTATQDEMNVMGNVGAAKPNSGFWTTVAGDAALGVLDFADTLVSSTVGRVAGIERGKVNQKALDLIGQPGLTQFYEENKAGIEVASGVMGIIAAHVVTDKLTKVAAPFIQGLKTVPYARRILALDTQYQKSMASLRMADKKIADMGIQGAEAFTAAATVPVARWTKDGLVTSTQSVTRDVLATSARRLGASKAMARAGLEEGVIGLTLNTNEFLFPEDWGSVALGAALGVGIPGAIGAVAANYSMKSFLQSDLIARRRAGALDPTGLEGKMAQNPKNIFFNRGGAGTNQYLGKLSGVDTDEATANFVMADARANPGVDPSTYNQLRSARQGTGFVHMEKVTQRGLMGDPDSAFVIGLKDGTTAEGRMIKQSIKRDSGAMYGVEMVGKVSEDVTYESRHLLMVDKIDSELSSSTAALNKLKAQPGFDPDAPEVIRIKQQIKQMSWAKKLTPGVLVDGERLPLSFAKVYDKWVPSKLRLSKDPAGRNTWESLDPVAGKFEGIAVDDQLNILGAGKKIKFEQQDHFQRLKTFRLMRAAIEDNVRRMTSDPKFRITLPRNANWMQLDAAVEIMRKTEGRARIDFPKGMDVDMAQVESFAQKVDALKAEGIDLQGRAGDVALARTKYNLPRLTAYQMGLLGTTQHPLDVLLRGAAAKGGGDAVRQLSLADLKVGFTQAKRIDDLSEMSARDVDSIQGDSFNFLLDEAGKELRPVMVYSRPLKPHDWTKSAVSDRIAVNKIQKMHKLIGQSSSEMIRKMSASLYTSADLELASSLSKLSDLQMAPSTPGLGNVAPNTATGSAINAVTSQAWRARFSTPIQALTRLRESADRYARGYAKDAFNKAFGDRLDRLAAPNTLETKVLLDQWTSPGVASGWDIAEATIKIPGQAGKEYYGFVLELTEGNRARFKQQFGRELTKGQQLIGPQGKPVVMDDLGMELLESLKMITDEQRLNKNSILRARGMSEIRSTPWYVPPPNLTGKYIAFTKDAVGKTIPGGTIIADTEAQLNKEISKLKADPNSLLNQTGNAIYKRQEIEDYGSVWDRAEMNLIDANATVAGGGRPSLGLSAGPGTVSGSFKSALEALRNGYHEMADNVMSVVMDDVTRMAEHRAHLASGESRSRMDGFEGTTYRSTYDYWLQEMKGASPLSSSGSLVGKPYNWAEGAFNRMAQERAPLANSVWHAMTDWATKRIPWSGDVKDREAFEKLSTEMGRFMPFQSVTEALEQRGYSAKPWTLSDFTGNANKFTATWMLRMLEVTHPLMNMAGVVNAMPSVIRQFSMLPGETVEQFSTRIGHSATIFKNPKGGAHGVLDMAKLAHRGVRDSMKPDAFMKKFQDYTESVGMRGQEIAEFSRQMQSIESIPSWKAFFVGDPKKGGFNSKGIVGWMSILSDKSEDFSRAISLDVGARLGRDLGIDNVESLANFAHDFANRMIADYSPHNRPEIFQGAVGAPFGLFQSFMWNYYERMFRYIETGDTKSFAIQAAMQGTMFGAMTIPGMDKVQSMFFSASDGESSPWDGFMSRFGDEAGDLLTAGTLSNIPKLFGADAVNLYSRGDTAARLPGFSTPASLAVLTKVKDLFSSSIALFSERNPQITGQQLGEILSNTLPNRPMAGMVESFMAGGMDTDAAGQLVTENVTAMETVYRVVGLRSLRQAADLEAFYANKQQGEIQAGKMEVLREGSRSLIRSGDSDGLAKIFETYVENGGDERKFSRWYKDNYEAATETRSSRMLEDLMRDPTKMGQVSRLLEAGVGLEDDNEEDPYTSLTGADPMDSATPQAKEEEPNLAWEF